MARMPKNLSSDLKQFQEIYEQNQLFVRKSLYWVTGRDSVDDIVQEVFLKIWKAWPKFKGQSSVKTWIYRITINCAYDYLKRDARLSKSEEVVLQENASSPESEMVVERLLKEAIQQLSEKQKEVFILYYIQGLPVDEVASLTEIAVGTVKSRLSSSREIVEACLEKHGVKL